jgi:hypothetical protein
MNTSQQAAWLYGGATNICSTFCPLFGFSLGQQITPSNRTNNEHLFINSAAVTGRGIIESYLLRHLPFYG